MTYATERREATTSVEHAPLHLDEPEAVVTRCRSIFISDIHLGTAGCKADAVLRFLDEYSAERLFLLGDIMDVWANRNVFTWPKGQIAVLRRILGMADDGVDVYYITGNHDRALGSLAGADLGNIHISRELVHETADHRRVLLTHGDAYDAFVIHHEWVARMATRVYHFITVFNNLTNRISRRTGRLAPLNICRFVRIWSKQFTDVLSSFATTISAEALRRECDGVICGHMHRPEIAEVGGVQYYNAGDWVEHCTALVEDFAGTIDLVQYPIYPRSAADQADEEQWEDAPCIPDCIEE